jgi:hypothetical protein
MESAFQSRYTVDASLALCVSVHELTQLARGLHPPGRLTEHSTPGPPEKETPPRGAALPRAAGVSEVSPAGRSTSARRQGAHVL